MNVVCEQQPWPSFEDEIVDIEGDAEVSRITSGGAGGDFDMTSSSAHASTSQLAPPPPSSSFAAASSMDYESSMKDYGSSARNYESSAMDYESSARDYDNSLKAASGDHRVARDHGVARDLQLSPENSDDDDVPKTPGSLVSVRLYACLRSTAVCC